MAYGNGAWDFHFLDITKIYGAMEMELEDDSSIKFKWVKNLVLWKRHVVLVLINEE